MERKSEKALMKRKEDYMEKAQIELIEKTLEEIDTEKAYLEMLNDCYDPVSICGYEYQQGDALLALDPIAFRCGHADFISAQLEDSWIEIDGKFYDQFEVEQLLEEMGKED